MKTVPQEIRWTIAMSPIGQVLVGVSDRGVCAVLIGDGEAALLGDLRQRFPASDLRPDGECRAAAAEVVGLIERPAEPVRVSVDLRGTEFQQAVWACLRRIPSGETITYSELAARVGRPRAVRAAAAACAANPVAILVPCHRVVGRSGALTGYRWGVERKRRLLEGELIVEKLTIDN